MIGAYESKQSFKQLNGLGMCHFKKLFKKLLDWTFYKVKSIILPTDTQIVQAVYYALPQRVSFQQQQILLHQFHLIKLLLEDKFPQEKQADFLQPTLD